MTGHDFDSKTLRAAQKFLSFHGYVRRCALSSAPLPGFAEDIVQQVFVEFVTRSERWDLETDLRPLLAKITRAIAAKYWREHFKTLPPMLAKVAEHLLLSSLDVEPVELPVEETEGEKITALWNCLDCLPVKSRQLIHSYYFEQTSADRLATELGVKVQSVNRTICRIREKLRVCIERTLKRGDVHAD